MRRHKKKVAEKSYSFETLKRRSWYFTVVHVMCYRKRQWHDLYIQRRVKQYHVFSRDSFSLSAGPPQKLEALRLDDKDYVYVPNERERDRIEDIGI